MALGFSEKRCHGRKGSHDLSGLWRHGRQTNQIRSLGTCPARGHLPLRLLAVPGSASGGRPGAGDLSARLEEHRLLLDDKAAKAWLITILRRKMHAASSASSLTSSISTSIPRAIRRHCTVSRRWRTSGSDAHRPPAGRISGTPAAAGAGGFSGDGSRRSWGSTRTPS